MKRYLSPNITRIIRITCIGLIIPFIIKAQDTIPITLRANGLYHKKKYQECLLLIEKDTIKPTVELIRLKADCLFELGNYGSAITEYKKLDEKDKGFFSLEI